MRQGLLARLETPEAKAAMQAASDDVAEGRATATTAARDLLDKLQG